MSPEHGRDGRIDDGRRSLLRAIPLVGLVGLGSGTASAANGSRRTFPDVIPLPDGYQPEGIVAGRGHEFFVGSLADGSVYRGDLRTGAGEVLVSDPAGVPAVGLSYDSRSDSLFVAGGPMGRAYVYDAGTGETLADYEFIDPNEGFVNDVVVTRTAAYFTDSFQSQFYRVPLGPRGQLPDQSEVETIELGGDFELAGPFNANGIDAPPDGEFLVIVNSSSGLLFRVDPATGVASEIDLGGETVVNGDGILLDGKTLYVLRNQNNLIVVVSLEPEATAGEVIGEITDSDFDVPTTVAEFGNALYAVNARFGTTDPIPPGEAAYDVVRVSKKPGA